MRDKRFEKKHCRTNYRSIRPLLDAVNASEDGHVKIEISGYMPLSIEKLCYTDFAGRPVYGMMHFYIQYGDLMRDPDITFSVDEADGYIIPLTYQQDGLAIYQQAFKTNASGKWVYSNSLLVNLDCFLWEWLRNLKMQGFVK